MSNAYTTRMPSGIQGAISREENKTIESRPYGSNAFASYGIPAKLTTGAANPLTAGDAATAVFGLLIRPYPSGGGGNALGSAVPPTTGIANLLTRGFATVVNNVGTPADQGQVYVRITANGGNTIVGGIEATSDTTHTVAPTGWLFNGVADAAGNVEIRVNI